MAAEIVLATEALRKYYPVLQGLVFARKVGEVRRECRPEDPGCRDVAPLP